MPGVRTTTISPVPSARTPAASGGRLAPRRTQSSRLYSTRTGTTVLIGQSACDGADLAVDLGAERPAVRQWRRRLATRRTPRRVGLEVRGLDPRRAQRPAPAARRHRQRRLGRDRGAPPLHLARRPPRLGERLADDPVAGGCTHGDERPLRSRVVGEPRRTEGDVVADGLRCAPLERRPTGGIGSGSPGPEHRTGDARPTQRWRRWAWRRRTPWRDPRSRPPRSPPPPLRWSASRCSGTGGP